MSKRKPKAAPEESGEKVPLWIISFADMITLLLSFFVMLQTMTKEKSGELFRQGQNSFRRQINGLGIPDLIFGKDPASGRQYHRLRYPAEESAQDEIPPERVIDADGDKIRVMFDHLKEAMQTTASDSAMQVLDVRATPIRFAASASVLDEASKKYLADLAADLRQNLANQSVRIYLIGSAPEATGKQQWLLSAKRAGEVEKQLRDLLKPELQSGSWQIVSLGAGAGGQWGGKTNSGPQHPMITVSIMGKKT